ncbi:MAG: CBS domain-containing protein [Euryarchaeota archaeon]|nr:CBS domain-containing protein [Euryarchaeota archaeon]
MDTTIRVKEAMTTRVTTVPSDTPVNEAARLMAEKGIGSIIVVDNGKPVGIITERDLAFGVVAKNRLPNEVDVREIMNSPIISVEPETTINEASRVMARNNIRRLPVIKGSKLVGILTTTDVIAIAPETIEILEELAKMKMEIGGVKEVPERGTCESCGVYGVRVSEVNGKFVCDSCKDEMLGGEGE